MGATLAHGSYVIELFATELTPDLSALSSLVRKAFEEQIRLLDAFESTPLERLATLSFDPDNLLRRMLPVRPGRWGYPAVDILDDESPLTSGIVRGPSATGAALRDRARAAALGVDRRADVALGTLYRVRDAAAAAGLIEYTAAQLTDRKSIPAPPLPNVQCFDRNAVHPFGGKFMRYLCMFSYDRYVAIVYSDSPADVRQKAAAQYVLLVRSR